MSLLSVTLPSGSLTIQENGTPNQAFGTIGFAAGALGALNLSTLTLVGDDADKFGLTSPTLGPDGTFAVNIFAKQPFDFENAAQRNFDVALQAALLGSILGSAITLVSDPISVTVTDANDNAPNGA